MTDLDETTADDVIAEQIVRFASVCDAWEWNHYPYVDASEDSQPIHAYRSAGPRWRVSTAQRRPQTG